MMCPHCHCVTHVGSQLLHGCKIFRWPNCGRRHVEGSPASHWVTTEPGGDGLLEQFAREIELANRRFMDFLGADDDDPRFQSIGTF